MFCLKIVKYVMEQFIVMIHIALGSRYKILSKIQFLRQTICSNNCGRKIIIGLVNSTLYDMDCRETKIRKPLLHVQNCSAGCL